MELNLILHKTFNLTIQDDNKVDVSGSKKGYEFII